MAHDLRNGAWVRSRACSSDGCVEVACLADGTIAVRDSKDPGKPPHVFDRHEWQAFIAGVKNGDFDLSVR